MFHACSSISTRVTTRVTTPTDSGLTLWPSVTLWSPEESTTEPKAESTRGSATVLVFSAGASANSAAKGPESGKLNAP